MPKGNSGIKREPKVRGVSQSEIDAKKGTQDHQPPNTITWQDVQAQYAMVGIQVTDQYAQDVHKAIASFSGSGYTPMRTAKSKFQKGLPLSLSEQQWLDRYNLCEEWCKVAPVFSSPKSSVIYRGISSGYTPASKAYAQKIKSLKTGDILDLDGMPSSFSTQFHTARAFASGKGGIIIHMPTSSLKNAPSIKGISLNSGENEVLVSDYGSKIMRIDDQTVQGDGYYHLYVQ